MRETWEEAGVRGNVVGEVAAYRDEKWGTTFDVRMYLLHVTEVAEQWDERTQRQRALVDIHEARRRIDRKQLHATLEDAYEKARRFAPEE